MSFLYSDMVSRIYDNFNLYNGFLEAQKAVTWFFSTPLASVEAPKPVDDSPVPHSVADRVRMCNGSLSHLSHLKDAVGIVGKGEVDSLDRRVRVTYVNGILTGGQQCTDTASMISWLHGDVHVRYVHANTQGMAIDLAKSVLNLAGLETEEARRLSDLWKRLLSEMGGADDARNQIIHYAHSRGGIITKLALANLTAQEKNRLDVRTFGSPAPIDRSDCPRNINIVCEADPIPVLNPVSLVRNYARGNVQFADPIKEGGLMEHGILEPAYTKALTEMGRDFVDKYGSVN